MKYPHNKAADKINQRNRYQQTNEPPKTNEKTKLINGRRLKLHKTLTSEKGSFRFFVIYI